MSWQEILTLAVVVAAVFTLTREVMSPAATMMGAVVVLLVAGVIGPAEALAGFSNPAPITVGALWVVAAAFERTGAVAPLIERGVGSELLQPNRQRLSSRCWQHNVAALPEIVPRVLLGTQFLDGCQHARFKTAHRGFLPVNV